jgi:hypothetical protein
MAAMKGEAHHRLDDPKVNFLNPNPRVVTPIAVDV